MKKNKYKDSLQNEVGNIPPVENEAKIVDSCHQIFDSMVTRNYLHSLSLCKVKVKSPASFSGYTRVRWFLVEKIVVEKDVFFADKLSMLYMSLHKKAKNILIWVSPYFSIFLVFPNNILI